MSQQDNDSNVNVNVNGNECPANLSFVKIFTKGGFRAAVQPGKLMLAAAGIILIFMAGWLLDAMTPSGARVMSLTDASGRTTTELEAYVKGDFTARQDFIAFRDHIQMVNEQQLKAVLMASPLNKAEGAAAKLVQDGDALSTIRHEFNGRFDEVVAVLARRYEGRCRVIYDEYDNAVDVVGNEPEAALDRDRRLQEVGAAYLGLFQTLMGDQAESSQISSWANQLVRENPRAEGEIREKDQKRFATDQKNILETCQLARTLAFAQTASGEGIFATFVEFKVQRMHTAVKALVFGCDLQTVRTQFYELLKGACWLTRFHPIFAVCLIVICLAVWAVVGGAICRITALQFARDERIGPTQAIRFSLNKFTSFFAAPLVPVMIILVIAMLMFLPGFLVAIPYIGEIIGGLLFPLSLLGGFVIALVTVGLIGGFNLMYPTIAVEGSDSFDAISRSFSYVFARPWRMGFYSLIAAVYGAACYLFVRFFAFLLLAGVRGSTKFSVNMDGSALINIRGKLDALWPGPAFGQLMPDIAWLGLNWSEKIGATFIWLSVALVAVLVMAFVVSFFYSANTAIYFLLRRRVDATDLDDVFVEQDIEELVAEEPGTEPDLEKTEEEKETEEKSESTSEATKEEENKFPEPPEFPEIPKFPDDEQGTSDKSDGGKDE